MQKWRVGMAPAVTALAMGLLWPAGAPAAFAPVDRAGPELSEPRERLVSSLACSTGLDGTTRTPVLLVHGTSLTPEENWSATYQPAMNSLRIPWCTVALPDRGTADIQRNAEYVVHAIREMRRRAGRPIAIVGASQGGMLPRWALRFWPDTRPMVDDLVGLAPSNHGTERGHTSCRRECFPAHRQQMSGSRFIEALNSFQETFAGVSYTNVYTRYDEVVTPATSAALHTGPGQITNVAVQDICPLDFSDHITLALANATGFALAMDALSNPGPGSRHRVGERGCSQPPIPGYNPARLAALTSSYFANRDNGAARVSAEPPLRCYVTGACPTGTTALVRLRLTVKPRRVRAGRRALVRVSVLASIAGRVRPFAGATVRLAGRRARTDAAGRARMRVRFRRPGRRRVTAGAPGAVSARAVIRVRRAR